MNRDGSVRHGGDPPRAYGDRGSGPHSERRRWKNRSARPFPFACDIVSTVQDVIKYFHEEPALLEPVTPDHDPDARGRTKRSDLPDGTSVPLDDLLDTRDAHRGYLAGTNRTDETVGLTAIRRPEAYVRPVMEALGRSWWGRCTTDGRVEPLDEDGVRRVLRAPHNTTVLVTAEGEAADEGEADPPVRAERMTAVVGRARRRALPALRALLGTVHVVFFPEPAHDGHDWSLWSASPMRERLAAAFREHPADGVRRFLVPYQKARSESKFYFDQWQLTASPLPEFVEEV